MIGDQNDMARRLATILPSGWFGDTTPVLDTLLQGLGSGFSAAWDLLQTAIAQTRIATAVGSFLDLISVDYFNAMLPRFPAEADDAFRLRITDTLLRSRGTRAALSLALEQLTGRAPFIFEPALTSDTGGYRMGGVGYGAGGGWGSLALPFQFFITAYRPSGGGIAELAGYGSGGIPVYGSLMMELDVISDSDLQGAVRNMLPVATTAWMRIAD